MPYLVQSSFTLAWLTLVLRFGLVLIVLADQFPAYALACAGDPNARTPHFDRLAREGIRQRGDFVGAHRVLTAAAGMAGRNEVAKAALQELRRVQPNISLVWIAKEMPIKQDAEREHYLEGFRRAGLH